MARQALNSSFYKQSEWVFVRIYLLVDQTLLHFLKILICEMKFHVTSVTSDSWVFFMKTFSLKNNRPPLGERFTFGRFFWLFFCYLCIKILFEKFTITILNVSAFNIIDSGSFKAEHWRLWEKSTVYSRVLVKIKLKVQRT